MIRKTLALIVACGLLLGFTSVPRSVFDARSAAVNVAVIVDGNITNICSGSVVELERGPRIVSAGHCVADHFSGEEIDRQYVLVDTEGNLYPATVEEFLFDPEVGNDDYAIFRSSFQYLADAIPLADEPLQTGDDVFAWSGPLGVDVILLRGYVSGRLQVEGGDVINGQWFVSMNSDGGSSGSVILNAEGEAVGVLVRGWNTKVKLYGAILSELPDRRN